jgi:hypothetical protein
MRFPAPRYLLAAAIAAAAILPVPAAAASPAAAARPHRMFDLGPAPLRLFVAETRHWGHLRGMLSSGDRRKLDAGTVRFHMHSQFWTDPESDPFFDRTRDDVRAGYVKLYREMLERQLPLDDLLDEALRSPAGESAGRTGPSWRLDVAPRLAVGSHGYLGARFSLPDTGITGIDRFSVQMSRGFGGEESSMGLRYSHGPRFVQLERATGDRETGERYSATVVLRF